MPMRYDRVTCSQEAPEAFNVSEAPRGLPEKYTR